MFDCGAVGDTEQGQARLLGSEHNKGEKRKIIVITGYVSTMAFVLNPKDKDCSSHWISENESPRKYEWTYNETLTNRENAAILADAVISKLNADYKVTQFDIQARAVPIWGNELFGAEVFYQSQKGTMRISARLYK